MAADLKGSTWKAFTADGWPNRYLIDPQGNIVMKVFGEFANHEMEMKIRELLAVAHPEVMKIPTDPEEDNLKASCGVPTQETFVGEIYGRGAIDDMAGHHAGEEADFQPAHSAPDGGVMLVGRWRVERDGVISDNRGSDNHVAAAEVRYHARSLYSVLSLTGGNRSASICFRMAVPCLRKAPGLM